MASSVTFVVVREEAFNRLRKNGRRLLGHRYNVKAFEETGRHAWSLLRVGPHHSQ